MVLVDLPEIDFIAADVQSELQELIALYESLSKRTLAAGDPLIPFLNAIAYRIIQLKVLINRIAKAQYLRYARKENLDHMGDFTNTVRLPAAQATVTIRFYFSLPLENQQVIPAGTRIGPDNGDGSIYFETVQAVTAAKGSTQVDIPTICNLTGAAGNQYLIGQLNTLIDPLPYVQSVNNLAAPSGGADVESDDAYQQRIRERPESFSVAGPEGAYEYWAKTANAAIIDVSTESPAPVEIVVTVLLMGGVIPGPDLLRQVDEKLNDKKIRPQTDKVTVQAPQSVSYNVNFTYYINRSRETEAETIKAAVEAAAADYVVWQKSKLGRDIDSSMLYSKVMGAGASRLAVTAPAYKAITRMQVAQEGTVTFTFGGFEDD